MKEQVLSVEQMQELIDMGIDVSNASMYISEYGEIISNVKICELGLDWTPTFTIQDILTLLEPCHREMVIKHEPDEWLDSAFKLLKFQYRNN